jgi:hypothetical protein
MPRGAVVEGIGQTVADAWPIPTKDDPWKLKTPPGTSDYEMYRDECADPPQLVCQVGSTKLSRQVPITIG